MKITTRDVCLELPADFKTPSRAAIDNLEKVATG
jgi:hypothetical protein